MLVSFVSAKGSPGVTTAVLAVASRWYRTAVVLDVDPFGGDVPAGLGRGAWPPDAGLLELMVDVRSMPVEEALRRRVVVAATFAPPVLSGFGGLGQAAAVPWRQLGAEFAQLSDADALADCGRYLPGDVSELVASSDHVVVVSGSSLPAARATSRLVSTLRDSGPGRWSHDELSLLVIRSGQPYSAGEVAQSCSVRLLGELPDDPGAARVWSDGVPPGRGFGRSALQREAMQVGSALRTVTGAPALPDAHAPGPPP